MTAYVREGSIRKNYLTRFIAIEYVMAQAAARRAQNVLGAQACLAGGAQLHTRENLVAMGSVIDTSGFAEDTVTTFETQLRGKRVVFDPVSYTHLDVYKRQVRFLEDIFLDPAQIVLAADPQPGESRT